MRIQLIALCALLAACSEPSITVSFEIPEGFFDPEGCENNCIDQFRCEEECNRDACGSLAEECRVQCTQIQEPDACQSSCDILTHACQECDVEQCQVFQDECHRSCDQGGDECWPICEHMAELCRQTVQDFSRPEQCIQEREACIFGCQQFIETAQRRRLSVYLPPEGLFGCEDLAFGTVDPAILNASLAGGERVPGEALPDLPRTGAKVFLAQALDGRDEPVLVGCAEVDDIDDDIHLELQPEWTAVMSLLNLGADGEPGGFTGIPEQVDLYLSNVLESALIGVEVRWEMVAPGIEGQSDSGITGEKGKLSIFPVDAIRPGPAILEIRARWQRGIPPRLKGFRQPQHRIQVDLPQSEVIDLVAGNIGPEGEVGFAGITPCSEQLDLLCLFSGHARDDWINLENQLPLGIPWMGDKEESSARIALVPSGERDRVVVVGQEALHELSIDGNGIINHPLNEGNPEQLWPTGTVAIGTCQHTPELLVSFQDGRVQVFNSYTGQLEDSHAFAHQSLSMPAMTSGCVVDGTGQSHQVLVSGYGSGSIGEFLVDMDGSIASLYLPGPIFGVGFSPDSRHLLIGRLGADSPEIARLRVAHIPALGETTLEELQLYPLFAVPDAIGGGDIDGDGKVDTVALLSLSGEYYLQGILANEHRGSPVSGMMPIGGSIEKPRLWVGKFDSDVVDDIAVFRSNGCHYEDGGDECQQQCEEERQRCIEENPQDEQLCLEQYNRCMEQQCPHQYVFCDHFLEVFRMGVY